jgi:drug/metabolite transporter (DMT)-like permease
MSSPSTRLERRRDRLIADAGLAAAFTLWSLNFAVVKVGLDEFEPLAFAFIRFGLAGSVLLVALRVREGGVGVSRTDLPRLALIGLLGIACSQASLVLALDRTTVVSAAFLSSTGPLAVIVLASVLRVERLGQRHWAAVFVGLAGAALVVGAVGPGQGAGSDPLGDVLVFAYVVSSSAPAVLYPRLLARYSVLRVLTYEVLLGTAILLPLALPSVVAQASGRVTLVGIEAILYAALCTGVVANLLYFGAVDRVGPSLATLFQYLQSFMAAIFGVLLLGEKLSPTQILGGVVILSSVVLSRSGPSPGARQPAGSRLRSGVSEG